MTWEYYIHFKCCDNEVPLGYNPRVGGHDKICLACDTADPETELKRRNL